MELEIKVMWCKGLTVFNFFQKLTVYASVSITTEDERIQLTQNQKQEQKTPVDENGGGDPEWNHPMKFDLRPLHNIKDLSLLFEFRCPGQIFGDKIIGAVRVPLKDLIQSVGYQVVRFVKYEVRNPEGKHNGILDFSYKLIGNGINSGVINPIHDVHHYYDHQNHDQHCSNSDNHMIAYHNHTLSNESVFIQYPKIDFDEQNPIPLVYPPPSSFTSTLATHYHPSAPLYPPPPSSQQPWVPPSHYLPPPQQQPYYVYPPPQHEPQPHVHPHWGYRRADSYHY